MVLNTIFLVREIRRNEQQDAFINAVTHELKTPVASIRLYLETLQTRAVDEAKRKEFYGIMLDDSDRLLATIEQVLRTGRIGAASRKPESFADRSRQRGGRVRGPHPRPAPPVRRISRVPARTARVTILADLDEVRAAVSNLIDNAVKYSGKRSEGDRETAADRCQHDVAVRVQDHGRRHPQARS